MGASHMHTRRCRGTHAQAKPGTRTCARPCDGLYLIEIYFDANASHSGRSVPTQRIPRNALASTPAPRKVNIKQYE